MRTARREGMQWTALVAAVLRRLHGKGVTPHELAARLVTIPVFEEHVQACKAAQYVWVSRLAVGGGAGRLCRG